MPIKKQFSFGKADLAELKKIAKSRQLVSSLWNSKTHNLDTPFDCIRKTSFVFGGKKEKKQKNAIIVETESPFGIYSWIYWPKPSDALRFALARKYLVRGGYADAYPGSVGVVTGSISEGGSFLYGQFHKTLILGSMQGCFRQKANELSRSLVDKHGGWRQHILEYIFQQCPKQGVGKVSFVPRTEIQKKIFVDTAEKNGFELESAKNMPATFVSVILKKKTA